MLLPLFSYPRRKQNNSILNTIRWFLELAAYRAGKRTAENKENPRMVWEVWCPAAEAKGCMHFILKRGRRMSALSHNEFLIWKQHPGGGYGVKRISHLYPQRFIYISPSKYYRICLNSKYPTTSNSCILSLILHVATKLRGKGTSQCWVLVKTDLTFLLHISSPWEEFYTYRVSLFSLPFSVSQSQLS